MPEFAKPPEKYYGDEEAAGAMIDFIVPSESASIQEYWPFHISPKKRYNLMADHLTLPPNPQWREHCKFNVSFPKKRLYALMGLEDFFLSVGEAAARAAVPGATPDFNGWGVDVVDQRTGRSKFKAIPLIRKELYPGVQAMGVGSGPPSVEVRSAEAVKSVEEEDISSDVD
ncbi:hypothetical protein BCR35DRAFT_35027 [Leucosporidium creatinivorum]|uniref:Uncharacterized protein n=1 Tax=Leucosporidium creatinivorum TaxID=106004 RepID=A0A1Y2CD95_9BASI|nr:hypothetical protein BCR35DRAFT_35027 [Leucosporidium creatinivorum]